MKAVIIAICVAILAWGLFILATPALQSLATPSSPEGGDANPGDVKKSLATWFDKLSLSPHAPPSTTPSPEDTAFDPAELIKTYRGSLVFVSNKDGAGSGFLASYGNASYLFTNAHVAAGVKGASFKTLEGEKVQLGAASVAIGHDILLMQAVATGKPFEIMKAVEQEAAVGDPVVVLGNAEGAGVINTITGKIVGIGPNLVEVDAPFVPGNSGSPIIHLKTRKVIGVATYLLVRNVDPATKRRFASPQIRRFGYRLDSVKEWQPVNWTTFSIQAQEMENVQTLTADLIKLVNDLFVTRRLNPDLHTSPMIEGRIAALEGQFRPHMSERDKASATRDLVAYLKSACRADVLAAQPHFTYDYFQRKLADELRVRTALAEIIEKAMEGIEVSTTH